jgi:hypothetical protein
MLLLITGAVCSAGIDQFEVRSIDGTGNNVDHPLYGSVGEAFLRFSDVGYADGIQEPAGQYRRMSARCISNLLAAQNESILNAANASNFVWQWGQFLDHDIDLTPEAHPSEPFNIEVPPGDALFDPNYEGDKFIFLNRSEYKREDTTGNPRQQINQITSFIDASNVYGSDKERAAALRTFTGGKLKTTSGGKFLPFNSDGLDNAGGPDPKLFLAGDVRANEQIALTAMHTLFVREHNRLCDEIAGENPDFTDEDIYQWARKIVGAQMQVITYNEFLPVLLGPDAIPDYESYNQDVNPGIANELSTAAFRFGHSMLSPALLRVNEAGKELVSTSLKNAFFNPLLIHKGGGISPLLLGLAYQQAQEVDNKIVSGVRNFLFGEPGQGGFDLAALNIQRGRDHGLADFNSVRVAYGLERVESFEAITSDPELQKNLRKAYGVIYDEEANVYYDNVDSIDLWVGGLAEDHVPGALVGKTVHAIITSQFVRLRDGDRFWYQIDPFFISNPDLMMEVERTRLSDIIRRNTKVGDELQTNVFLIQ